MSHGSVLQLNLWKQRLGRVLDSVWEQTELLTPVLADNALQEVSELVGATLVTPPWIGGLEARGCIIYG
jgi:hypothetical protein